MVDEDDRTDNVDLFRVGGARTYACAMSAELVSMSMPSHEILTFTDNENAVRTSASQSSGPGVCTGCGSVSTRIHRKRIEHCAHVPYTPSVKAASLGEDCAVYPLDQTWVNAPKPGRLRMRRWKRTNSRKPYRQGG